MKYMVKVTGERNYTVEFNTENERLNWLNRNAQKFEELDGKWLTNLYNDEVELVETEDNKEEETMTTKINKDRYNALRWAVTYALKDMDVNLYEHGTDFGKGEMRWDVNWSALGNKTPAEAVKFAENLKMAADMAEALNEMHMEMVWEDDEALNALIIEDREEAIRRWDNFKMMIVDQLYEITALDPESYDRLYELMTDYTI